MCCIRAPYKKASYYVLDDMTSSTRIICTCFSLATMIDLKSSFDERFMSSIAILSRQWQEECMNSFNMYESFFLGGGGNNIFKKIIYMSKK